ncbi:thio(seleno)oxazole modification radical SAM maturase SbtM [Desulfolithobacter sp.]
MKKSSPESIYPVCCRYLASLPPIPGNDLVSWLADHPHEYLAHPFLPDLARLEQALHTLQNRPPSLPDKVEKQRVNPALELLPVAWHNLPRLLSDAAVRPEPGQEFILLVRKPDTGEVTVRTATSHDLLALKLISEDMDPRQAAREGGVPLATIDAILFRAMEQGLILSPPSRIVRPPDFPRGEVTDPSFFTASVFTLQWHITQTCDLHCRHCYDRSDRATMELAQGIKVLDDLYDFARAHHVHAQVTFTGGNPLLYPHFNKLYREAAERGFLTAILGNPMPRHRLEEMLAVQKPEFYQVSLEGLQPHNDYIRGPGHFERVLAFLDLLRELDIYSMVMLTLTRANMDEVLELAEVLRDKVDLFTFNRLAMVGEGASLAPAPPERFEQFLNSYMEACRDNSCMGLKDNFFNLVRHKKKMKYTGGCAGYGCGAAFNFVSILPDGEVHACRKLPSPMGNIFEKSLQDIYHSPLARRYRRGSSACADCAIRPVCGGCLAVTYGLGRDIFTELDPYCFR